MIPNFKTYLKESHWSEMNRRSQGITARKEDDVNLMNDDMFFEYLIKRYWRPNEKIQDLDRDHYSREFDKDIVVDPIKGCVIYGSYKDGELKRIFIVYRDKKLEKMLKSYQGKFIFTPSKPGTTLNKRYYVTGKDDQVSNKLFVDLIELFLSYSKNETLKESHWSEMNRRSQGIAVRKEDDVDKLNLGEFYKYLIGRYESICGNKISISFTSITMPLLCGKAIANLSIRHYNYIFTICMYEKDMSSDFLNSLEEKYYVNIDDWFQGFKNVHLSPKGKSKEERLANHDFVKIIDDILDMDKPHGLNNAIKRKY